MEQVTGGGSGSANQGGAPKEDYLDKGPSWPLPYPKNFTLTSRNAGLDAAEKKFGQGKINPEQSRGMNEKITDGARNMFEKATG